MGKPKSKTITIDGVDVPLLKRQKAKLVEIIWAAEAKERNNQPTLKASEIKALNGILNLLDAMQDIAESKKPNAVELAFSACETLVAAYGSGAVAAGESVEWSDVDDAHTWAKKAVEARHG